MENKINKMQKLWGARPKSNPCQNPLFSCLALLFPRAQQDAISFILVCILLLILINY